MKPSATPRTYDPKVVLELFRSEGKLEEIAPGRPVFVENETKAGLFAKSDRMYLLLEGEISLSVGERPLASVHPGEVFGELASLSRVPRSATATAKQKSRFISLDSRQFERALQKVPEAALMFMTVIIERLRAAVARAGEKTPGVPASRAGMLDRKLLAELRREFDPHKEMRFMRGQPVMKEGDAGMLMYVVLEGDVEISIRGRPVERLGPGGVFGEMALVDAAPRSASAAAASDASLLGINRGEFLALVRTRPGFGVSLLRGLAERLAATTAQLK